MTTLTKMLLSCVSALVVSGLCLAALPAAAETDQLGHQEYMNYCSSCHGDTAMGDGPISHFINVSTPSLTTLAAQNDGVFPFLEVAHVIDGRTGIGPHGTIMPVWGDRFKASAVDDAGVYGAETVVRGRIYSLVTYLESIQE